VAKKQLTQAQKEAIAKLCCMKLGGTVTLMRERSRG
jgi:hypothetical protein